MSAALISYQQLDKLNCNFSSCSGVPSWLKAQNYDYYWTGSYDSNSCTHGYIICVNFHPSIADGWYSQTRKVRPVVTISKDDIKFD